ncbi:hypothetical protein MSPP1_000094 [Malassezia sp. CBS 17886]|nr:hypothetical protein MSPP1_000094 [Malassezia sp. CBS 17886]
MLASVVARRGTAAELLAGYARWQRTASAQGARVDARADAPVALDADVAQRSFRHWKSADTGRWQPPKYSARRQAALVHAARTFGMLDEVAASPKHARMLQRLQDARRVEVAPTARPPTQRRDEDAAQAMRIARKAHSSGPYAGRAAKRMFKGSHADKDARARAVRVRENMRRMDSVVQEWRDEKIALRRRAKPTSPL